jgi:hypothetical protein
MCGWDELVIRDMLEVTDEADCYHQKKSDRQKTIRELIGIVLMRHHYLKAVSCKSQFEAQLPEGHVRVRFGTANKGLKMGTCPRNKAKFIASISHELHEEICFLEA